MSTSFGTRRLSDANTLPPLSNLAVTLIGVVVVALFMGLLLVCAVIGQHRRCTELAATKADHPAGYAYYCGSR